MICSGSVTAAYFGGDKAILQQLERIKRKTLETCRLQDPKRDA